MPSSSNETYGDPNTPPSLGIGTEAAHIAYGAGAPASRATLAGCATQKFPLGHDGIRMRAIADGVLTITVAVSVVVVALPTEAVLEPWSFAQATIGTAESPIAAQ